MRAVGILIIVGILGLLAAAYLGRAPALPEETAPAPLSAPPPASSSAAAVSGRPKTALPLFLPDPADYQPPARAALAPATLDRAQLRALVDDKNACDLFRDGVSGASLSDIFRVLNDKGDHLSSEGGVNYLPVSGLFDMFGGGDPAFTLQRLADSSGDVGRFFAALLRADLFEGYKNPSPDPAEALGLFASLRSALPQNGAVPFFSAAVRLRRGDGEATVRADLLDAMKAPGFDAYFTTLLRVLWGTGVRDPKLFTLANTLIEKVPAPDYGPSYHAILDRITAGDPEWAALAYDLGKRWMQPGLHERGRPVSIYWSPLEYSMGRKLARKAWGVLHPEEPAGEFDKTWPTYQELARVKRLVPLDRGSGFPPRDRKGGCAESDFVQVMRELDQENSEYFVDRSRARP